jgi:hypothetical protein
MHTVHVQTSQSCSAGAVYGYRARNRNWLDGYPAHRILKKGIIKTIGVIFGVKKFTSYRLMAVTRTFIG